MRSLLPFLFMLLMLPMFAGAQFPCVNGISTNPANPINNQLPSKRNTFFDWQLPTYAIQPLTGNCTMPSPVESPFYKTDNLEALRDSKDMNWSDGWELLRRGFGLTESNTYTTDPVPNIYFILYNRYTGILRVLLKVCRGQDYNAAKLTIRFDATSEMKTDLLEFSRSITALDKPFTATTFSSGSVYVNDNTKWYYADFPMMYDPCTCAYKSKLNIISELVTTSSISLTGSIGGDIYTKDVGGKAQIQKSGSYSWKDFAGSVNGKVSAAHSSINSFLTETQKFAENLGNLDTVGKKNALVNFASALKSNTFLKAGLSAVPWLKTAVSLVDVFIGGGKATPAGPQEVKLLPLTVNLTAKLNGTMTTVNQYHDIKFTNPGSKDAALDPPNYPYYNEVLGIFNLIKTPEAYWERRQEKLNDWYNYPWLPALDVIADRFKLDTTTFRYVLNPASGLAIQNMQLAFVTEGEYVPSYYTTSDPFNPKRMPADFFHEGKDAMTGDEKFRTNFIDGTCFAKRTFEVFSPLNPYMPNNYYGFWGVWRPEGLKANDTTLFLKIMLNLRRTNATPTTQNVLYVVTYPVKIKTGGMMNLWENDGNCNLISFMPAASTAQVNSFCNTTYNGAVRQKTMGSIKDKEMESATETADISIAPNPNTGFFTMSIVAQKRTLNAVSIIDYTGRYHYRAEVLQNLEKGYNRQFNIRLSPGLYWVVAHTNKGILKTKIMVQ